MGMVFSSWWPTMSKIAAVPAPLHLALSSHVISAPMASRIAMRTLAWRWSRPGRMARIMPTAKTLVASAEKEHSISMSWQPRILRSGNGSTAADSAARKTSRM